MNGIIYDKYLKKPRGTLSDGSWIKYTYSGDGTLIRRELSDGTVWDYLGPLILKNGELYQITTPEGRAVHEDGTWHYEFEYRDNVGNLRLSFRERNGSLQVTQKADYSPFGVKINHQAFGVNPSQFTFHGQEDQGDFELRMIGMGARCYNPTIGRFLANDAYSQVAPSWSGYRAFFNNPVSVTDPTGNIEFTDGFRSLSTGSAPFSVDLYGSFSDPIFDSKTGEFLGHYGDSDFNGEIMMMDASTYEMITGNDDVVISPDLAEQFGTYLQLYVADNYRDEDTEQLLSNVFTNLLHKAFQEGLITFNPENLANGQVSIDIGIGIAGSDPGINGKWNVTAYLSPVSLDEYRKGQFTGTRSLWYTNHSGNAINILGVHEPLHQKYPGNVNHFIIDPIVLNPETNPAIQLATPSYIQHVKNRNKNNR